MQIAKQFRDSRETVYVTVLVSIPSGEDASFLFIYSYFIFLL